MSQIIKRIITDTMPEKGRKIKEKARGGVQRRQKHRAYYYSPLHPLNSLTKMRFDKETISGITVTCSFPLCFHLIGLVKGKIKNERE